MAAFDEYEYEGKRVKVPAGTEPTEELLDSLYQEQETARKRDAHLQKRNEAQEVSEISFPRASRAIETILSPIAWAGEKFDRIGGAPTRSAIAAMQDGKGLSGAISAFGEQFGAPAANSPTGKQIATNAGLSPNPIEATQYGFNGSPYPNPVGGNSYSQGPGLPSPAGVAGFGVDAFADPTILIPFGAIVKAGTKGVVEGSKMAAKATANGAGIAADAAAIVVDAATGTKAASKTVNATKAGIKSLEGGYKAVGDALKSRFGTKLSPDFEKSLMVAQDNGIAPELLPESIMFGPNSSASRMARVKAEGPLGQPLLERHEKGIEAIRDAIKKDIRSIGGEVTEGGRVVKEAKIPPNSYSAGELIKNSYDEGVDRAFSEIGQTHNKIIEAVPDLQISPDAWKQLDESLSSLKEYAEKRAKTGITKTQKEQGKQLLNAVENIQENSKTYSGMVDALRDIGDVAFKSKNVLADIPPDISRFRGLYNDLNKSLVNTVRQNEAYIGQNAANDLLASNKKISAMYGDKSLLASIGDEGKSPERLFKGLILDGDAKRITSLKKYMTPEQFQQVKAAALNTLIKENPQGEFTFRMLHNSMRNKKDVLSALFSPDELKNIDNLVQLGDKFGPAVMSTSGTGASGSFGKLISAPVNMVENSMDAVAASKQKAAATRAIGFQMDDQMKTAAKKGQPPATMSLSESGSLGPLGSNPRPKLSQLIYTQQREEE